MTEVPLNDLSRWRDGEIQELLGSFESVLASGTFMLGPLTRQLESEIARVSGQASVIAVANGTEALYLALRSLDVNEDWTVFNVANAGGYTTHAALRCEASVVFVDVNPETAQMSGELLRAALKGVRGPKVVVVTHLYGLMAEIEEISTICHEFGAHLIEDCAQATGAKRGNRAAGSFGDAATFSFYPTKNLGALGDGGAVALSDPDRALKVRELAQYGWSDRYKITRTGGINSRIDELQSAVLLSRLRTLGTDNEFRRQIVRSYAHVVAPGRKFFWADDSSFVGHLAVMKSETRDSDLEKLRQLGVQCGIHYPIPDHRQPAWSSLFNNQHLPYTDRITEEILTVPCFPRMSPTEISRTKEVLQSLS